jgi:predicted MFS family arabinose efflux permease
MSSSRRLPGLRRAPIIVRNPSFGLLWAGQLLSDTGSWLLVVAVPVYVLHLTGSARDAGLAFVAEVVPILLLGPAAGVLADRWRSRTTMIVSDLVRAGCVAALITVSRSGQLPILLGAVFAENAAGSFFRPAHNTAVPALVGRGGDLSTANAWYATSSGVVRLVGGPVGGVLYLVAGFGPVAAVDAATYLVSAALVAAMPALRRAAPDGSEPGNAEPGNAEPGNAEPGNAEPGPLGPAAGIRRFAAELHTGLAALLADPVLRVLVGISMLFLLGNGALTALLVPYVVTVLRARSAVVGVLFCALGAGYLLSGYAGRTVCASPRLRAAVLALVAGVAAAFCGFFDWHELAPGLVFIALAGLTGGAFLMVRRTLVQRRAAEGLVGRVSAACGTAEMAATLAGAGLASVLVSHVGLTSTLNGAIAVIAAGCALASRLPAIVVQPG